MKCKTISFNRIPSVSSTTAKQNCNIVEKGNMAATGQISTWKLQGFGNEGTYVRQTKARKKT